MYTCKIAAEIVVVPYMTVLVRLIEWSTAPVVAENASLRDILLWLAAVAEAVREYLVHYTAFEKLRCLIGVSVNCELEHIAVVKTSFMDVYLLDIVSDTALSIREIVVMHIGVSCIVFSCISKAVLFLSDFVHAYKALLEACSEKYENRRKVRFYVFRKSDGEAAGLKLTYSTEN